MGCADNDCSSCAQQVALDAPKNDIDHVGVSREKLFYEVLSMGASTLDVLRYALHDALDTLSYFFREYPTLPSNPSQKAEPLLCALETDKAVYLPLKHCAFTACSWRGNDTLALAKHVVEDHMEDLQESMSCFEAVRPCVIENQQVLALSVYNEGIAMAVRRGAPLASFSIDRKCLQQYTYHLANSETKPLVCFVCARRFLHVSGAKNNDIDFRALLTEQSDSRSDGTSLLFLGMQREEALGIFGLKTYCETCGKMSENVHFDENHEEFADWHVRVRFQNHDAKVLCCPEYGV